jgi:hypothetical protein
MTSRFRSAIFCLFVIMVHGEYSKGYPDEFRSRLLPHKPFAIHHVLHPSISHYTEHQFRLIPYMNISTFHSTTHQLQVISHLYPYISRSTAYKFLFVSHVHNPQLILRHTNFNSYLILWHTNSDPFLKCILQHLILWRFLPD